MHTPIFMLFETMRSKILKHNFNTYNGVEHPLQFITGDQPSSNPLIACNVIDESH